MSDDKEWTPDYYVDRLVAAARSAALEEAAKVALSTGSGPYSSTAGWALSERIAAAIRELKGRA